jgi:predicted small lipoprotein YifL
MRNSVNAVIVMLLFLWLIAACGQKGPLFLPGNTSEIMSVPPVDEQLDETDEDHDDDDESTINP